MYIELDNDLKEYLSKKYNVDKKLIYYFGFDEKIQKHKMIAHVNTCATAFYLNDLDMRIIKIKQLKKNIYYKKYKKNI